MSASLLSISIGFRNAEDILATIVFIYVVIFLLVNGGLFVIERFPGRSIISDDDFKSANLAIEDGSTGGRVNA